MKIHPQERLALFIDGANLYAAAKSVGYDIDYRKLLAFFETQARLIRAFYYTAFTEGPEYCPVRPLVDWLYYNGYTVVTRPAKTFVDAEGNTRIKGNMDVELAVDMMEIAEKIDHAILFSGDGDFRYLVESVQRRGTFVTVISSANSDQPIMAGELRRQADCFVDLAELRDHIGRDPAMPRPRHALGKDSPEGDSLSRRDLNRRALDRDGAGKNGQGKYVRPGHISAPPNSSLSRS